MLLPGSQLLTEFLNEGHTSPSRLALSLTTANPLMMSKALECVLFIAFKRVHGKESLRKANYRKESFCFYRAERLQAPGAKIQQISLLVSVVGDPGLDLPWQLMSVSSSPHLQINPHTS